MKSHCNLFGTDMKICLELIECHDLQEVSEWNIKYKKNKIYDNKSFWYVNGNFLTQKENIEKKMVKSKSFLFILCETKMFESLFGLWFEKLWSEG